MKRINFKNLSNDEILTRDELKRISGGNGSGDGEATKYLCSCDNMTGSWGSDTGGSGRHWACGTPDGPYTCVER